LLGLELAVVALSIARPLLQLLVLVCCVLAGVLGVRDTRLRLRERRDVLRCGRTRRRLQWRRWRN
jgi:hypothetical protein